MFNRALGVFDCVLNEAIERGDVAIVTVVAARAAGEGDPLVFFRGKTLGAVPPAG